MGVGQAGLSILRAGLVGLVRVLFQDLFPGAWWVWNPRGNSPAGVPAEGAGSGFEPWVGRERRARRAQICFPVLKTENITWSTTCE